MVIVIMMMKTKNYKLITYTYLYSPNPHMTEQNKKIEGTHLFLLPNRTIPNSPTASRAIVGSSGTGAHGAGLEREG